VGLVNTAPDYNPGGLADNVPWWIPMFAETYGPEHTINLVYGKIRQDDLSPDSMGGDEKQVFLIGARRAGANADDAAQGFLQHGGGAGGALPGGG